MSQCPKCRREFPGKNLSSHLAKCGVPLEILFWSRVDKRSQDECWPWQGRRDKSGYGRYARKGENVYAHRIAYRLTYGPIPDGKDILHTCDNRWCCNPLHYFLGTQTDNNADMWSKNRATTKLTPEQVLEIRAAFAGIGKKAPRGMNQALADKYGVGDKTICLIRHGKKWRHIPDNRRGDVNG